ncbi:hypothetical protein ACIBG6_04795 [Streptomyces sp. NPDC050842]|uniref:hypothetical protein n=1 Tax=Streptomyces sp. NPDC050842 TaxID=3365636 RepID=UPI003788F314
MSPYARTKAHFESALENTTAGTDLRAVSLRRPRRCRPACARRPWWAAACR